jgi:hypothetical protein
MVRETDVVFVRRELTKRTGEGNERENYFGGELKTYYKFCTVGKNIFWVFCYDVGGMKTVLGMMNEELRDRAVVGCEVG